MKVLTAAETKEWLIGFPDDTEYVHCDGNGVFFTDPEASCIDIEYPSKLEKLPFLVRFLATLGYESRDFNGALVWFTQWDVWNRLMRALVTASLRPCIVLMANQTRLKQVLATYFERMN